MGSEVGFDPTSTPKLSFYSLPSKPPQPPGSLTPPLQTLASVPFKWEEAPGKPRHIVIPTTADTTTDANLPPFNKSKAARCLELPPRLFTESSKVANIPSPTTVFEGPGEGRRTLSHTLSFSFGVGGGGGEEKAGGGKGKNLFRSGRKTIREKSGRFGSWRWGSFKDSRGASVGSFDFSSYSYVGGGCGGGIGGGESACFFEDDSKVKIARSVRRRSSFMKSSVMAKLYGSFKQAVPWKRRNN